MLNFFRSFGNAIRGILLCVKYGRNIRIQLVVGLYILLCAPAMLLTRTEWAIIMIMVTLVPAAEIFNTSIERTCDQICREFSVLIKFAKDAAAGSVLLCAVGSAAVGVFIFTSPGRMQHFFSFVGNNLWYAALLVVLLIPCIIFIIRFKLVPADNMK